LYEHLHVPFGLKASRRGNPAREDISMKKIKSIQRSALINKQNNEGVRVVKKGKGKTKSNSPAQHEKKTGTFEYVKGIIIQISAKWIYDNWSLVHDKASICIDVLVEILK